MTRWLRPLLYGAAGAGTGLVVFGSNIAAWSDDAKIVAIVFAFLVAVLVEGLIWLCEELIR